MGEKKWSVAKRAWCCAHGRRGCSTTRPPTVPPTNVPPTTAPPATSLPFDCNAGYGHWQAGWSRAKKAWCCANQGKGCPPAPTPIGFNCYAGFSNWKAGWSASKKEWCCAKEHKGCPGQAVPVLAAAVAAAAAAKTTPCPPQDCNAAFQNWRAAWTPQKKQ